MLLLRICYFEPSTRITSAVTFAVNVRTNHQQTRVKQMQGDNVDFPAFTDELCGNSLQNRAFFEKGCPRPGGTGF